MPENEPHLEDRPAESYIAIPVTVTMQTLAAAIDRGFPELFGWLASHQLPPAGAPFVRYLRIDMETELEIELAVPIAASTLSAADGRVRASELPAGRYVVLVHVGSYDGLIDANATLQDWPEERGLRWRKEHGTTWGGRVERYLTDPAAEPDSSRDRKSVV